jgi:L-lactate dehydrogenase complex protein LldF
MGGHAYGTTYSGPIGAVITPYLCGLDEFKHLSYASTLCGKCSEVCPVKIPLHDLLLHNRNDAVKAGYSTLTWKTIVFGWKKAMLNRWIIDLFGSKAKNLGMNLVANKLWGPRRDLPVFKQKSFNQTWKDNHKRI